MQLQDLETHYKEALSLHTIFQQMGFAKDQLVFVAEHLNVGIAIMEVGRQYQFNCCYLEACYRREDVIAGWPQAMEVWYGEEPALNVEAAEAFAAKTTLIRWRLIYDSAIYRCFLPILDVLVAKQILDYPRAEYVYCIEAMKAQVGECQI